MVIADWPAWGLELPLRRQVVRESVMTTSHVTWWVHAESDRGGLDLWPCEV